MTVTPEWSAPMTLTTPQGDILFNQANESGERWQLIPDQCDATQDVAGVKARISGGDGDIISGRTRSGFAVLLAAYPFKNNAFAFGADLNTMRNDLELKLNSLLNPSLAEQVSQTRLTFEITGEDNDWMLDRARLFVLPKLVGMLPKVVTFGLDTEYPYVLREDQQTQALTSGVPATIDHSDGTTKGFPTYRVDGPVSSFTLQNDTALDPNGNPIKIVYDDSLPGPPPPVGTGDYLEIWCWRETVVLNGDENFGSIAGIDIPISDLRLPLVPGLNTITLTGADGEILWNSARA